MNIQNEYRTYFEVGLGSLPKGGPTLVWLRPAGQKITCFNKLRGKPIPIPLDCSTARWCSLTLVHHEIGLEVSLSTGIAKMPRVYLSV